MTFQQWKLSAHTHISLISDDVWALALGGTFKFTKMPDFHLL